MSELPKSLRVASYLYDLSQEMISIEEEICKLQEKKMSVQEKINKGNRMLGVVASEGMKKDICRRFYPDIRTRRRGY